MTADEAWLDSVGRVYDAALGPNGERDVGAALRDAMQVESWITFVSHHRTGELLQMVSASSNFDEDARRDYRAYYHERNVWYQNCTVLQPPYVARGEEIIDPRAFDRTEFGTDWCRRVGIHHMIGCFYPIGEGRVVACGVHLPRGRGPFADRQKHRFEILMRHLARAVQMRERLGRLEMACDAGFGTLAGLGVGSLVVDGGAQVVFANDVAERVLRSARWLAVRDGTLQPVDARQAPRFAKAVREAAETAAGQGLGTGDLLVLQDPVGSRLSVLVGPLRMAGGAARQRLPAAVVTFADPAVASVPGARDIAEVLGITPAEARLVASLAGERTLVEAARELRISLNTAKAQLQSVFRKSGHQRQPELVAAVRAHPVLRLRARPPEPAAGGRSTQGA